MARNLSAYADIAPIVQAAYSRGGAIYTLPSAKAATRWRMRANSYRVILREIHNAHYEGLTEVPELWIDRLQFLLSGPKIEIQLLEIQGHLTDLHGAEIEVQVAEGPSIDNNEKLAQDEIEAMLEEASILFNEQALVDETTGEPVGSDFGTNEEKLEDRIARAKRTAAAAMQANKED